MLDGFAEELERDLLDLHCGARAQPPVDSTVERDRRVRMAGNMATAARKIRQLGATAREATRPSESNEDGMRERLDDPDVMERKKRDIAESLDSLRDQLLPGGHAGAPDAGRPRSLSQKLAQERQPRAA